NKLKVKMKKMLLRALSSLENWLKKQSLITDEITSSLASLREALNNAPEEEGKSSDETLPPPQEIADEPGAVALYSDGGCRGNPGPGAYAFVIQENSGKILGEGVEFEAYTTNNKMELSGPIRGLLEMKEVLP